MRKYAILGLILLLMEASAFILLGYLFHFTKEIMLLLGLTYFMLVAFFGHYRFSPRLIWQEIVELLKSQLLYISLMFIVLHYIDYHLIIPIIIITGCMFLADVFFAREMRVLLKRFGVRVLMLGASKEAEAMTEIIQENRFLFTKIVGYVDLSYYTKSTISEDKKIRKKLIPLRDMNNVIRKKKVEQIYILESLDSYHLDGLMNGLVDHVPVIKYHPGKYGVVPYNTKVEDFEGELFISIFDPKYHLIDTFVKKIFDVLCGLIGTILCIPLTLIVKILFVLSGDMDPVFFIQERIGLDGKIFKMIKYRTMVVGAEDILEKLLKEDPKMAEEYRINKKLEKDPRVTKAGSFLRKTSLDEFPQFINVLKGDMSLIGPRPYLEVEKADMKDAYKTIIKSKPGISGIWQANGRSNINFEDRLKLDLYYYENWSITLDIIIIVKTIKAVLFRVGAK